MCAPEQVLEQVRTPLAAELREEAGLSQHGRPPPRRDTINAPQTSLQGHEQWARLYNTGAQETSSTRPSPREADRHSDQEAEAIPDTKGGASAVAADGIGTDEREGESERERESEREGDAQACETKVVGGLKAQDEALELRRLPEEALLVNASRCEDMLRVLAWHVCNGSAVEEEVSAWWVQQHNQRRRRTHRIFGAVQQCVLRGAPATLPGGGDHLQAHRDACAIVVVDKKTSFDQQDAQRVIRLSQRWASCLPPAEGHAATRERLRHRAGEFVRSLKAHAHALSGSESARELAAAGGCALPGGEFEFVTPAAAIVEALGRAAWSRGLTV